MATPERITLAELNLDLDKVIKDSAVLKKQIDELKKSQKELDTSTDEGAKAFEKNAAELKKLSKTYRDGQKLASNLIKTEGDLTETIRIENKSNQELRNSRNKLINLADNIVGNTKREIELRNRLTTAIDEQTEALRGQSSSFSVGKDQIGEYSRNIREALGGLNPLQNGIKGSALAMRQLTKSALAFIATPIGAAIAALATIGLAVNEVLKYNQAIRPAIELTEQLTHETGELADNIRIRAETLSQSFNTDFKENIISARALVNEFGISYEKAFDLIQEGYIRGGAANGDFLEQIKEYPTFFASAGFSAEEFINIINTGADLAIYNDKLPDAVKESTIAISEATQGAKDALKNAFGEEFTGKLLKDLENNAINVKDAIGLIASESKKSNLNIQQQAQLTADVLKGAGEDAGGLLKVLGAINTALNEEQRELTNVEKAVERNVKIQNEYAKAKDDALKSDFVIDLQQNFSRLSKIVGTQFFRALKKVQNAFQIFTDTLASGIIGIISFFKNLKNGFSAASQAAKNSFVIMKKRIEEQRKAQIELVKAEEERARVAEEAEKKEQNRLEAEKKAAKFREKAQKKAKELAEKEIAALEIQTEIFLEQSQIRLDKGLKAREIEKNKALDLLNKKLKLELIAEDAAALEKIKILNNFEKAKTEIENAELQNIENFNQKKLDLENELAQLKAETEFERQQLALENEYERAIAELERLEYTEDQKTQLLALLEDQRKEKLAGISKAARAEELNAEKELTAKKTALKLQELEQAEATANGVLTIAKSFFGESKALLSAETLINTYFAAQKAYASQITPGDPTSVIRAVLAAAAAVASGLANVKKINQTQPEKAERGMILRGKRHFSGGIPFKIDGDGGFEAEDGEGIINRKSVSLFTPLLSAVNSAGGGIPFTAGAQVADKQQLIDIQNRLLSGRQPSQSTNVDYVAMREAVKNGYEAARSPIVTVEAFDKTRATTVLIKNSTNNL